MDGFLVLVPKRHADGHFIMYACYLNRYPLDMEDCICDNEDEHTDDGCQHTGWFVESKHPDYDTYYETLDREVVGFAEFPDPHLVYLSLDGAPW